MKSTSHNRDRSHRSVLVTSANPEPSTANSRSDRRSVTLPDALPSRRLMVFTISLGMISERSVESVVVAGVVTRQSRIPSVATAARLSPTLCRKMPLR